jgi:hypothetical protein
MRKAILLLVLFMIIAVAMASRTPAGKRVYGFREDKGNGTNGPIQFFCVGDFKRGLHIGPCGFGEAVNWTYTINLSGAGDRFTFDKVDVEPNELAAREHPSSGEVLLDRTKNQVAISLKMEHGTNIEDFIGNGTFTISKRPY